MKANTSTLFVGQILQRFNDNILYSCFSNNRFHLLIAAVQKYDPPWSICDLRRGSNEGCFCCCWSPGNNNSRSRLFASRQFDQGYQQRRRFSIFCNTIYQSINVKKASPWKLKYSSSSVPQLRSHKPLQSTPYKSMTDLNMLPMSYRNHP